MTAPERYRVYAILNFVGLPLTRSLGYLPGRAGLGIDLPKDAFLQWAGWVMSPRYLFDDPELEALQNFPKYKGALRALCMSDDSWATRPAVELLCSGFTSIKPEIITLTPADTGARKIGHIGLNTATRCGVARRSGSRRRIRRPRIISVEFTIVISKYYAVLPREGGVSSTPRLLGSITAAS